MAVDADPRINELTKTNNQVDKFVIILNGHKIEKYSHEHSELALLCKYFYEVTQNQKIADAIENLKLAKETLLSKNLVRDVSYSIHCYKPSLATRIFKRKACALTSLTLRINIKPRKSIFSWQGQIDAEKKFSFSATNSTHCFKEYPWICKSQVVINNSLLQTFSITCTRYLDFLKNIQKDYSLTLNIPLNPRATDYLETSNHLSVNYYGLQMKLGKTNFRADKQFQLRQYFFSSVYKKDFPNANTNLLKDSKYQIFQRIGVDRNTNYLLGAILKKKVLHDNKYVQCLFNISTGLSVFSKSLLIPDETYLKPFIKSKLRGYPNSTDNVNNDTFFFSKNPQNNLKDFFNINTTVTFKINKLKNSSFNLSTIKLLDYIKPIVFFDFSSQFLDRLVNFSYGAGLQIQTFQNQSFETGLAYQKFNKQRLQKPVFYCQFNK